VSEFVLRHEVDDAEEQSQNDSPPGMPRITVRITSEQLDQADELVDGGRYPNRSELIRTAVRSLIDAERGFQNDGDDE